MEREFDDEAVVLDPNVPSVARIYDYFLGGKDNFACDREFAGKLLEAVPEARAMANDNRNFLARAVRYLAEQGIRQFIDVGTGLPTQDNVHQVAQSIAPDARVVYADNDPVVLAHARALLADNPNTIVIDGDLREPDKLLTNPDLRKLIDFDQPLAILLIGIVYFLPDTDQPFDLVATLREAIPPGGYLALSHICADDQPDAIDRAQELYRTILDKEGDARRTRQQIQEFFAGLDMVEPGLVYASRWRAPAASAHDRPAWMLGGVGHKPRQS